MISNSATHLWSYTNSTIDNIARNSTPISPETPRRYRHIEWQVFKCFMMFHNVLRVFHDVLLVVHNVLQCITMFYKFFMIFYYV